jgi:hypothetical protein
VSADLLAPLSSLPGVAAACDEVREALGKVHRHRTNLRGWPASAAESALRGARSSSVLDGGSLHLPAGDEDAEPVLAGALRVNQSLEGGATGLVTVWQRAPMQALARLHSLAAADLTDEEHLGRPRSDPEVTGRLALLAQILDTSTAPAPVLAAVAHGELLTLAPFGTADGVVARAVSRLITIVTGLDPHGLGVPEVYWMRRIGDYRAAAEGFTSGAPESLRKWILLCCDGLREGAREGLSIATSAK